ncbi:MAG: peptidylprolyl isomerase [Neisseria sp.]|nr:peptidylprolyl isomerase [Neisseria sp.]
MLHKILPLLVLAASLNVAHAETRVLMETSAGQIELSLDEQKAPKTVENFVRYAEKGFYDNTVFHRVIPGFMIQGGGFTADMRQKDTDKAIDNEAGNGLSNRVGTIAMARTAEPNSATSQFFINVANNDFLNHQNRSPQGMGYAVFGRVTKGMDVVNKIAAARTANRGMHQDVPVKAITIKSVKILNK